MEHAEQEGSAPLKNSLKKAPMYVYALTDMFYPALAESYPSTDFA